MGDTAENIKKYNSRLTPEEAHRRTVKARATREANRETQRLLTESVVDSTKALVDTVGIKINDIDKPPQIAIDKCVELASRRVPLKKIRAVFGEMSDKAWENLKNYAFREEIARPEDAGFTIQKNAEAHAKVLKKRIAELRDILDRGLAVGKVNFSLLEMLYKAEDDLYQVQTIAIEKSYRVGAFGNKKKTGSGGIVVKFNLSRPPELVKDITPQDD